MPLASLSEQGFAEFNPATYLGATATNNRYHVTGFSKYGLLKFHLPLPVRGHSFAMNPQKHIAVQISRRPGRYACEIDLVNGAISSEFSTPDDRHFYGHGVFSSDGRLLYTTENNFDKEIGVIGVYDSENNYKRVGEMNSYGIGPHEIKLLWNRDILVVANGGILTHPDLPRVKLNIPTMSPSLCYIDRHSGQLLRKVQLEESIQQLSIRHIDVNKNNMVAVAGQYEGPAGDLVPLVALHQINGDRLSQEESRMQWLKGPKSIFRSMKHYCGSVSFDTSGEIIAVSAPRGNLITFWSARNGHYLSTVEINDSSGVASTSTAGEFFASTGRGELFIVGAYSNKARRMNATHFKPDHWDNHLMV